VAQCSYPYVHYHSMIHEDGGGGRRARVQFGCGNGEALDVMAGDVVGLFQTPDLVVIGAYPPNGHYNLCRGSKAEHALWLAVIPQVSPSEAELAFGPEEPLLAMWRA